VARALLAIGGAGLGECDAAPHRAVPGAAGKGPTFVGTSPRPSGCVSGHQVARAPPAKVATPVAIASETNWTSANAEGWLHRNVGGAGPMLGPFAVRAESAVDHRQGEGAKRCQPLP